MIPSTATPIETANMLRTFVDQGFRTVYMGDEVLAVVTYPVDGGRFVRLNPALRSRVALPWRTAAYSRTHKPRFF